MTPPRDPTDAQSIPFKFPPYYSLPPFFSRQPNAVTRRAQFEIWSSLILSYCRHYRIWRLSLIDALDTPLFFNSKLKKRLSLNDAREVLDWITKEEGPDKQGPPRAEWIGKEGEKSSAWIYWRRPEEWAEVISEWVEGTGQKNTVLTLYELTESEGTLSTGMLLFAVWCYLTEVWRKAKINVEFHSMDPEVLQKSLAVLVKRGKAQIFGSEDQEGVKFF